jgi:hypothetical protein
MVTPANYVNSAVNFGGTVNTLYHEDGALVATSYALTSWNVGSVYEGVANMDLATGQEVGSWDQRGVRITSGVANTAGLALGGARVMTVSGVTAPAENLAVRTYFRAIGSDIGEASSLYNSYVQGTGRLNIEFGGRELFRAANNVERAAGGRFAAVEQSPSRVTAVMDNALHPSFGNMALDQWSVRTRFGLSVEGTVRGIDYLPGGNMQVFQNRPIFRPVFGNSPWRGEPVHVGYTSP